MSNNNLKPEEIGTQYDRDLKLHINQYGTLTNNQVILSQYAMSIANSYVHATIPDATVLVQHNMLLGTLSEFAFAIWLYEHGFIDFQTDLCIGRPDKFDFMICGERYDVKSTNIDYCMYIKKYHIERKPSIYLYCQRNIYNDSAAIVNLLGWNTPDDIKKNAELTTRFEDPKYQIHKSVWRSMNELVEYINGKYKTWSNS